MRLIVTRTLLLSCNSSQRRLFDEPLDFSDSGRRVQHESLSARTPQRPQFERKRDHQCAYGKNERPDHQDDRKRARPGTPTAIIRTPLKE